mmetsp:Transcript_7739/g.22834  ORF Transcript_7739/g.22834 Transcript_7739/m.22834 type:complete len:224 (+) Transcript_7739:1518-2189(+)
MMTTFRGGSGLVSPLATDSAKCRRRNGAARDRSPSKTSVFNDRSCASSRTTAPQLRKSKSLWSSRSNTPSVSKTTRVASPRPPRSYLVRKPTSALFESDGDGAPSSAATRSAVATTATRRGCVTAIRRPAGPQSPASYRNCGTCVDLPEPVSPLTITTSRRRTASTISCSHAHAGNRRRAARCSSVRATAGIHAGRGGGAVVVVPSSIRAARSASGRTSGDGT